METIEYRGVVDKAAWPRGPWDDEPDKIQWRDDATGLPCLIVRGPHGALCGYVGVPAGHLWHGCGYDDVRWNNPAATDEWDYWPQVHGGLTFAGGCGHGEDAARGICHIPGAGEPDDVWWLGFDCAHCGDVSDMTYPADMRARLSQWRSEDAYRDVPYVTAQCRALAEQALQAIPCDSNSDPQGGDALAAPGEASQSGGAEGAASPNPLINQETPHAR